MTTPTRIDAILRAMTDPAFYPHDVSRIEIRQTHISAVLLTGQWVYKLKKPKDLGFLDFRKLADRERFCRREAELNGRLSNGVYAGVVAIHEDDHGRLSFGPGGRVVEYAVKMRQLPEEANLARLLESGMFNDDRLEDLGRVLAAFHAGALRSTDIDGFGDPDLIRFNMEENFEQIGPYASGLVDVEKWEFIRQVSRAFWQDHQDLFRHRVQSGRIRDGHGDLRADHVYLHEGIQIIDCIEFNDRFRYGDTALDLAFLKMDLDRLGFAEASGRLVAFYARAASDPEVYALLDFYAAYRALVRLKVSCMSLDQADEDRRALLQSDIRAYLGLALRYALSFGRPTLWVFCGLPASGKSTLAEATAEALFMPLFSSDAVRKEDGEMSGASVVPIDAGPYRPLLRGRIYARLLNLAMERLRNGSSVVLDATFSESRWRRSAIQLADDLKTDIVFAHCVCSTATLKRRLAMRDTSPGASDARLFHLDEMQKRYEVFDSPPEDTYLRIDTDETVESCLHFLLSGAHALKTNQAERIAGRLG